jgi:hypothetical protein
MTKKKLISFLTIIIGGFQIFSQIPDSNDSLTLFEYQCYNGTDSIYLPADYIGPKYFCHEEGCIIDFLGPDLSMVSILCAGCTTLVIDSKYILSDTIQGENGDYYKYYYWKSKDKYACICRIHNRTYKYQDVTSKRKNQLDRAFGIIKGN